MWLNTVHSILFPICPVAMYLNLIGKLLNNADTTAKFENIGWNDETVSNELEKGVVTYFTVVFLK